MPRPKSQPASKVRKASSQKTILEMFEEPSVSVNDDKIKTIAASLARYIILRGQPEATFHKRDLMKHIKDGGRVFDKVIVQMEHILNEVYGYKLHVSEVTKSDRLYLISNNLPYLELDESDVVDSSDCLKILIMLVLSHIYMSNNRSSDTSLYSFLQSLRIELDESDPTFGKVKDHITKTMVKQRYLVVESEQIGNKAYFSWGSKAECTISKLKILEFVAKTYKCKPKDWANLYAIAQEQAKSLEADDAGNQMDESQIENNSADEVGRQTRSKESANTKEVSSTQASKSNRKGSKKVPDSFIASESDSASAEESSIDDSSGDEVAAQKENQKKVPAKKKTTNKKPAKQASQSKRRS